MPHDETQLSSLFQQRCTRRRFIKTAAGTTVVVHFIPISAFSDITLPKEKSSNWQSEPGVAKQRIDGHAKVTGQKIYARDFRFYDMHGWPQDGQHIVIVRAKNTTNPFTGFDLKKLGSECQPVQVLYGDEIISRLHRPRHSKHFKHQDHPIPGPVNPVPDMAEHPYIVPRGETANYYGQPLAFLYFNNLSCSLKVQELLRTKEIATYDPELADLPYQASQGMMHLVRYHDGNRDLFSFYQNGGAKDYQKQADQWQQRIQQEIDQSDHGFHKMSCSMQAMDPMFMEPESGMAWYDSPSKTLNMLLGTQSPGDDVNNILTAFSHPKAPASVSTVNFYTCYLGGGFGGRDRSMLPLNLAIAAVASDGVPIRIANTRFEQFQSGVKRHGTKAIEQLHVDDQGFIQNQVVDITLDGGGRKNLSPFVVQQAALMSCGAYSIPKTSVHTSAEFSENIISGAQRGFGGPQAFFAIETLLDDIARTRELDPISLRMQNLLKPGGTFLTGSMVNDNLQMPLMLKTAQQHKIWQQQKAQREHWHRHHKLLYGVGFAMTMQSFGTGGEGLTNKVHLNRDGTIEVATESVDMGNGSATTLALATADVLGTNANNIHMGQSNLFPLLNMHTGGETRWKDDRWTAVGVSSSGACETAYHQSFIVGQAARVLYDAALIPAALALWQRNESPANMRWHKGLLVSDDERLTPLSMQQLAEQVYQDHGITTALAHGFHLRNWVTADYRINNQTYRWVIDGLAVQRAGSQKLDYVPRFNGQYPDPADQYMIRALFTPCASLIGLTVNAHTGETKVRESATILNAGKVLCEPLVSGQSQGGLAMSIGYTLMEDIPPGKDGAASGQWNLDKYQLPKAQDVPIDNQELVLIPPLPEQVAGRGIGEAAMCAVPAAISNAMMDATGHRFTSMPITSAKVLARLQGKPQPA
ncbi:xanthine dehydrogenase family protein molybdopterin-binding subunit [Parendozoicomonas haliclonae]|uniref:Xanthine dehydrogenase molybdenum-binding subunit n=1 Tax=Parendozoicomonas haliclonae TaxID=1960125 RepID=A0A1X7AG37_9GAMM|nr:molybdopterin cofactor-binding domain-containing protein [Parendozoicomonas haliclonae]SMA37792.1 Xanthine dehydrogenase molybdenum-binding subunit [Parendozoicomonas haliclonae]